MDEIFSVQIFHALTVINDSKKTESLFRKT